MILFSLREGCKGYLMYGTSILCHHECEYASRLLVYYPIVKKYGSLRLGDYEWTRWVLEISKSGLAVSLAMRQCG